MNATIELPSFESYGDYSSSNYGVNALVFTDAEGRNFYFSYKTLVAVSGRGIGRRIVHQNYWSQTTGKHLNWIDGGSAEAKAARLGPEDFEAAVAKALNGQEEVSS